VDLIGLLFNAIALLALVLPQAAIAQTFDGHGAPPVATSGDPLDPLLVWSADGAEPGALTTAVAAEYAREPLVRLVADGSEVDRDPVLGNLLALNLNAAAWTSRRLGVAMSMPVFLFTDGVEGAAGPAPGDLRLWLPSGRSTATPAHPRSR